jgi:hypothetical protein
MDANDESAKPAGESDAAKQDKNQQKTDAELGFERLWNSPIGTGEPIPFDPTKFVPPLSKEEIEKLLEGEKR